MKKVLIFGGNGFVGKYLSKEFKEHGYTVCASDISAMGEDPVPYVDRYDQLSILDAEPVEALIGEVKPDYIINLAAVSSVGASWSIPRKTMEVNVNGSLTILEAVRKKSKETKILLVGSSEEYAVTDQQIDENVPLKANNPYGISKVAQEMFSKMYREEYGLRIVNTRTFNHTGSGQPEQFVIPSFVRQAAVIHQSGKEGEIKVGNLSARRDIGDVRDMVAAYRMILESDSAEHVFNVGSGSCYLLEDILNYILSLTNQKIRILVDEARIRPLDNPVIWCDNRLIRREIGWEPKYTVFDAINRMFRDMADQ